MEVIINHEEQQAVSVTSCFSSLFFFCKQRVLYIFINKITVLFVVAILFVGYLSSAPVCQCDPGGGQIP